MSRITVRPDGLVIVRGIPVCRRVVSSRGIEIELEPRKRNSRKSRETRGSPERITLKEFVEAMENGAGEDGSK